MKLVESSRIEGIKCDPLTARNFSRYAKENLFKKMMSFCLDNKGIGLAAPQIGLFESFFVAFIDGHWQVFVNPKITKKIGERESTESCLSYPGLQVKTKRASEIIVKASIAGKIYIYKYSGQDAAIIQHEYDHLNGITIKTKLQTGEAEKIE